ncbi:helix-turn-helix domain-containing protein [Herbaspirillum sp.]|jgi:transcriptional regulator with XRE-family HTH domain|uniref:helix-turn-helix domain-containing protein n=1 Tax=Herbaspirillum TaxID=963 RepID=UPI002587ECC4|nr:helix-turn-helix transcriptional regulator [Herbaspirillum sp.]MCP3653676.1 helix-turn-helix transcriptional regulator [Herbaspirillum sp.]MCP3947945.1 helix-turn-helix transcriptional regulator [Herbaspirillum sp.]MCP4032762.1 helix-turn-helix transcriptional regulator [Herbaspirillum sp.]MCP4555634.1 helix-turn-helix transcriptional regulator [Herbaspirillum sp.]
MAKPEYFGKINDAAGFGAAIRAARKAAGMRIADVCALANVSIQTLSDIESGKPTVSIGKMLDVADCLGVSFFSVSAEERHTAEKELPRLFPAWHR